MTVLAFSADGRILAVAGSSGTVQLWDVPSSRLLGSALPTPGDPVLSLAFSPAGHTLYAVGRHAPFQKYDIEPAHLVAQIGERAGSGLSRADWNFGLALLDHRNHDLLLVWALCTGASARATDALAYGAVFGTFGDAAEPHTTAAPGPGNAAAAGTT